MGGWSWLKALASRIRSWNAGPSTSSSARRSIARRTVPVSPALNRWWGVRKEGPFGEGQLDDLRVGLTCTHDSVVRPNGRSPPFPFLEDGRVGLVDEPSDEGELLAAPVSQLPDPCRDELGGGPVPSLESDRMTTIHAVSANEAYAGALCCEPGPGMAHRRSASRRQLVRTHASRAERPPAGSTSPSGPLPIRPRRCRPSASPCPCPRRPGRVAAMRLGRRSPLCSG